MNTPELKRPRVGHIQFLNCFPLYYGLVNRQALFDIELIKGTPTELNRDLVAGKLDISPISSIEYARNYKDLLLLPDLTVSCDGPVMSIFLVSKEPIEKLDGKTIALTNTSATSVALLKIILAERYHVQPTYFVSPPDLGAMLREADAALLIGDPALQALYQPPEGLHMYDLGQEWHELTGEKFVFAVWAARREFVAARPEDTSHVYYAFKASQDYSLAHLAEGAAVAARWEVYTPEFLASYFHTLRFVFDPAYQRGLLRYYELAAKHGYLETVPALDFISLR